MGDEQGTDRRDDRRDRGRERGRAARDLDRERRSRVAKILVALFLSVLFILFIIRNSDPVSDSEGVDFVFVTADVRLIWVFLVCAVLGGLVGYLLGRPSKAQRRVLAQLGPAEPGAPEPGPEGPPAHTER